MPHRILNLEEVAGYLHRTPADVRALVKHGEIPCEQRGGRPVFLKRQIDEWASRHVLALGGRRLNEYHRQSTQATRAAFAQDAILEDMVRPSFVATDLTAKTKASVLRQMTELAAGTGQVNDPAELLASLEAREAVGSTAVPGGVALLHPQHHLPYLFETSFLVLGRTLQEIFAGAPDGRPTTLFFLLCCQDDRIHLHLLARLCLIVQESDLAGLHAAPTAESLHAALLACEQAVLRHRRA